MKSREVKNLLLFTIALQGRNFMDKLNTICLWKQVFWICYARTQICPTKISIGVEGVIQYRALQTGSCMRQVLIAWKIARLRIWTLCDLSTLLISNTQTIICWNILKIFSSKSQNMTDRAIRQYNIKIILLMRQSKAFAIKLLRMVGLEVKIVLVDELKECWGEGNNR
jgi:hypothetical protein